MPFCAVHGKKHDSCHVSESEFCLRLYDLDSLTCKWPFQGNDMNCFDSNVGVCSSSSLATRRGTRKLIYILAFILLKLLTTSTSTLNARDDVRV